MELHPYLIFDGNCREAMTFYAQCLRAKIVTMQTHGESPMAAMAGPESRDRILHARIEVGDYLLMASDCPPGQYEKPASFSVSIMVKDPAEAERIFSALAENGTVRMPIQETFWALRFGMLVDRFGIPWMIDCDRPEA